MQIDRESLAIAMHDVDDPVSGSRIGALIDSDDQEEVCRVAVDAILADIEAQGFVVVPKEPSEEVIEAAARAHCDYFGGDGWWDSGLIADTKPKAIEAMQAAYAAMIDAGKGEG